MKYQLRDYQEQCVSRSLEFLLTQAHSKKPRNGLNYLPTGSGKSLCIASTAIGLAEHPQGGPAIIFQPTMEILKQNLEKIESYGFSAGVFSASMNRKDFGDITLATIGSAYKNPEWFADFQFGLVDEAHLVNVKDNSKIVAAGENNEFYHRDHGLVREVENQDGIPKSKVRVRDEDAEEHIIPRPQASMFKTFIEALPHLRWLGYSGSPYRLTSDAMGSQLKMITRTRPRLFDEFVHWTQNRELFDAGYLAKLEYYQISGFKKSAVALNSSGSDYSPDALQLHLWEKHWQTKSKKAVHFPDKLTEVVNRLLDAGRRNVLVFTSSIRESEYLAEQMKGECAVVTGETPKAAREAIAHDFRSGQIKVVSNTNCWVVGFDFPELETVIDAAGSMSLARYQQKNGRAARPHENKKSAYCVDMVEGYKQFGPLEDLTLYCQGNSRWDIFGRPGGRRGVPEKQLTSVYLSGAPGCCPKCGAPKQIAYYTAKQKWLPISIAPAGTRANLIVEQVNGKKTCRMVDRGEGTHCFHFLLCQKFQRMRQSRQDD